MVFTILDTPRTEIGDQTRMSINDPDFSTAASVEIPSPTRESNDLLKQIRGMRSNGNAAAERRTPRSRLPLSDRRGNSGVPPKGEFTPLLKSATRNSFMRSSNGHGNSSGTAGTGAMGKENRLTNGMPKTPAGLKASYGRHGDDDSPGLPFNSSVIVEEEVENGEYTGSEHDEAQRSIVAPPVSSSSALSTPMALRPRNGGENGALDHRGNLATLREQEERLEQIDKENFSLKLKIHFLEEALRKNGKEFNETALRENTELKVDKVTLQRDLKNYRRSLAQAEKDLESYKQQLKEYVEKVKRRHVSEDMQEELEQLRQSLADGEAKIEELQGKVDAAQNLQEEVDKLKDDYGDLEAEIRQKDQELDEKHEELETLRQNGSGDDDLKQQLEEKTRLLEEREDDIEGLQEALRENEKITEQKLHEKQTLLEEKDDELRELEDQLKDQSQLRSKDQEGQELLKQKDEEIQQLKQKLEDSSNDASVLRSKTQDIDDQRRQIETLQEEVEKAATLKTQVEDTQQRLEKAENDLEEETRKNARTIEDKDSEIYTLEQKLQSTDDRNEESEKLHDQIADLEAELREKDRMLESKEEEIDKLNEQMLQAKQEADDELNECEDRVQQLETEQERHLVELQNLRDSKDSAAEGRSQALETAQTRIRELEGQIEVNRQQEKELQADINKLHDKISRLESNLREKEASSTTEKEKWARERRSLESQKSMAEEQCAGLKRTIAQLHESEGTLSSREMQLKQAMQAEEERHRSAEDGLQKRLQEAVDESEARRRSLETSKSDLQRVEGELADVREQLNTRKKQEAALQEKIAGLEDEVELLQCSLDEAAEGVQDDLDVARQEAEGLRGKLKGLQQDLATTQSQLSEAQQAMSRGTQDDANASQHKANGPSNSQLQLKVRHLEDQLEAVKHEKAGLEEDLAENYSELDDMRSKLESNRAAAEKQSADLRKQMQDIRLEHERKSKSQVLSYEQDIQNLEQDLAEATSKLSALEEKNHAAEQQITRLQSKVKSLDAQLANARAQRASGDTSVAERKDLHEMLKDAKLEAEDLTLQVKERDGRIEAFASKEAELRTQLRRLREERAAQAARTDALSKDMSDMQRQHDDLHKLMASLRADSNAQKQVRFPSTSASAAAAEVASTGNENAQGREAQQKVVSRLEKRHAAELRGLVKQIEYLSARCKRETRFRADLCHVKHYFTRLVEMHTRCTGADLKLVRAMGIPVDDVVVGVEQEGLETLGRGRVLRSQGRDAGATRPTLRAVALMVVAGVRMRKGAEKWAVVRKGHDALVKKLKDVQMGRADAAAAALAASGKKAPGNDSPRSGKQPKMQRRSVDY